MLSLSNAQARVISEDKSRQNILLNSCCPGFVLTEMTAHLADDHYGGKRITVEEGVDTPLFLALLPTEAKVPHGKFFLKRQSYDFINSDEIIQR